jgi:hypothetical protein
LTSTTSYALGVGGEGLLRPPKASLTGGCVIDTAGVNGRGGQPNGPAPHSCAALGPRARVPQWIKHGRSVGFNFLGERSQLTLWACRQTPPHSSGATDPSPTRQQAGRRCGLCRDPPHAPAPRVSPPPVRSPACVTRPAPGVEVRPQLCSSRRLTRYPPPDAAGGRGAGRAATHVAMGEATSQRPGLLAPLLCWRRSGARQQRSRGGK